jgi:hypothetical protein
MLPFIFVTLDTNVGGVKGEEFGEGFKEVQGQLANQGKPFLISCYLSFLLC